MATAARLRLAVKRTLQLGLAGVVVAPPATYSYWYTVNATKRQQECISDMWTQMPEILRGGWNRALRSAWAGLVISLDYKWTLRGLDDESEEYASYLTQIHQRAAQRVLDTCLANTGLYIKFGQGLVAMNHILPKEYTETLSILQDQALRRESENELENIFIEDLGKRPDELFRKFNPVPIAAASLAQVYVAETLSSGLPVAVKVQYADLRERFDSDVATFKAILDGIEVMHPKFGFAWILDELSENMENELDFQCEADNSEKCKIDLQSLNFAYVPDVWREGCSKRILVTEFIDGIKISDTALLKERGYSVTTIDERLIKIMAEQVFHSGFVHADPHPGNLLVRGPSNNPQIVLLDHGLYQELPTEIRQPLARVWQAVVENNHTNMKKYSEMLGIQDYRLFCMAMTQRYIGFAPWEEKDFLGQYLESKGKGFKALSRKEFKKLSEEDKSKLRLAIRDTHDKMLDVFQNVPSNLMLVFRNFNIIRAIIRDHSSGVDRHRIMARSAVKGYFVVPGAGPLGWIRGNINLIIFELYLLVDWATLKLASWTMAVLRQLGFVTVEVLMDSTSSKSDNSIPNT